MQSNRHRAAVIPAAPVAAPPAGRHMAACDLVMVPARQGLEAVDILRRGGGDSVGPVLHDGGGTLGFLVPPGTAARWDVPGSTCGAPPPPTEADWLLPPRGAHVATDPTVLRAALGEAARLIRAADSCR